MEAKLAGAVRVVVLASGIVALAPVVSAEAPVPPPQDASTNVKGKHAAQPRVRGECVTMILRWCMKLVSPARVFERK